MMRRAPLQSGPLAAMADEILAHADNVMQATHARYREDFWNAIQRAMLLKLGDMMEAIERRMAIRARHISADYEDAYTNALVTGTGIYRMPQLNAIQRAVADKIKAGMSNSRMVMRPDRSRTGRGLYRLVSANEAAAAGVHRLRHPSWPAGDHVCIDIQPDRTVGPLWQLVAPSGLSRALVENAMNESHDKPIWRVFLPPPGRN